MPRPRLSENALACAVVDTLAAANYAPMFCRYYGRRHRQRYIERDGYTIGLRKSAGKPDQVWLEYEIRDVFYLAVLPPDGGPDPPLTPAQRVGLQQAMVQQYQTVLARAGFATRVLRHACRLLVWDVADLPSADLTALSDPDLGARFDTLLRQLRS